jgi:hypothetical protein
MSGSGKKLGKRYFESVSPSAEFEKMLATLQESSPDTVKEVERVIKTPDSETKLTYEVQVDPETGKHKVIEKFTTTKRECAICNGYFSQVVTCERCGAQVCASHIRHRSWDVSEDQYGNVTYDAGKIWSTRTVSKRMCVSCAGDTTDES